MMHEYIDLTQIVEECPPGAYMFASLCSAFALTFHCPFYLPLIFVAPGSLFSSSSIEA